MLNLNTIEYICGFIIQCPNMPQSNEIAAICGEGT